MNGVLKLNANSMAEELTLEVKEIAFASGANLVGIVSASAIDSFPVIKVGWKIQDYTKKANEIMLGAKSVVVIGYHVWDDMLELATKKGEHWVYPGYFPVSLLERTVETHLKMKGFKTVPDPSISYKRLAQLAGFGNYGKNALIINPDFGPWIRLATVLTNAPMIPDKPFELDLCGDCVKCIKACPIGALSPYEVDDQKCLVGVHLLDKERFEVHEEWRKYEPSFTENSHLMCIECQKVCKYGNQDRYKEH